MTIGLYRITDATTGRFYVGSSRNCERRFNEHRKHLRAGRHHSPALQGAWNKRGEAAFAFELIAVCWTADDALEVEQEWLDEHYGSKACLNGSRRARMPILAPEVRARAAEARAGSEHYKAVRRRVCLERNADPTFQQRAREGIRTSAAFAAAVPDRIARLHDPEVVKRNRDALRNSEAQKAAARARAIANNADPLVQAKLRAKQWRAVKGTHLLTGEIVRFASQSEAARALGVRSSNISQSCRGLVGPIKGYRWELASST